MEAIIFQDGVYVYVKGEYIYAQCSVNDVVNVTKQLEEDTNVILGYGFRIALEDGSAQWQDKYESCLYGGRVRVWFTNNSVAAMYCQIDGILIEQFQSYPIGNWSNVMPMQMLAAILNDIEQLGVDAFLENYKKELNNLLEDVKKDYSVLEDKCQGNVNNLVGEDRSLYFNFRKIIQDIRRILFSLSILLCSGLTNSQYIQAYCNVMTTYFS